MVSYVVFCIVFFKYGLYHSRFDAVLSEKCGRGFSPFYFPGIKAHADERVKADFHSVQNVARSIFSERFHLKCVKSTTANEICSA